MTYELYKHTAYTANHAKGDKTVDKIERLKRFFISAAGLLKRFWNWLKEPRRTPGEQWAIDNGVHGAWEQGYADGWKGEDHQPFGADDPRHRAYYFGNSDADIDIHMQK